MQLLCHTTLEVVINANQLDAIQCKERDPAGARSWLAHGRICITTVRRSANGVLDGLRSEADSECARILVCICWLYCYKWSSDIVR